MAENNQQNNQDKKKNKLVPILTVCGLVLLIGTGVYASTGTGSNTDKIGAPKTESHKSASTKRTHKKKSVIDNVIESVSERAKDSVDSVADAFTGNALKEAHAAVVKNQDKLVEAASVIAKKPELPENPIKNMLDNDLKTTNDKLVDSPKDGTTTPGTVKPPKGDNGDTNNNNHNNGNSNDDQGNGSGNDNTGEVTPPVTPNATPTITGKIVMIHVKDNFDPMQDMHAYDQEDGDITNKLVITYNDVNTNQAGWYHVRYSVTDSAGTTTKFERNVLVLNARPVITGQDISVEAGSPFDVMQGITATDQEDGDVTNRIQSSVDQIDTNKVGTTEITYTVTDDNGSTATFKRSVTVYSENATFEGLEDQTVFVGSKVDLLKGVKATNKYDDDFINKIKTSIDEVDTTISRDLQVTYSVTDRFGHTTEKTIIIHILKDVTPMLPSKA